MSKIENELDIKRYDIYISIFLVINFILAVFSTVRNVILHYKGILSPGLFCDHIWIYRECAYALRGIDMSEAIRLGIFLDGIGQVSASSTWPWAKILGVVVHGAFLSEKASQIYAVGLYILLILATCLLCYRKLIASDHIPDSIVNRIQVVFLFLSSWYYVYLACAFNNGSFVCLAIIAAIALIDDKPVLAGVIMAFAMIKAQIAIPFFVVFLIRRKWKVIWTSVLVVLSSWVTSCILMHITPWEQIKNLLHGQMSGSSAAFLRYGMFDFIMLFDNSKALLCMILSALTGLIILVFIEKKVIDKDLQGEYVYLSYYHAAIVALLWMYTTKCDYLILTIVAFGMLEMWHKSKKGLCMFLFCLGIIGCSLMNLTNLLGQGLAKVGIIDVSLAQPLEGRFDTVLLLLMITVLSLLIRRRNKRCAFQ